MENKIRKIYAVILVFLMLFSYLPPLKVEVNAAEYTAQIDLVSTASKYNIGDTIQVKLVATNLGSHGKIIAGTGRITYDKTALKLTNIVPGDTSVYMQDTQGIANDRMNISRPNSSLSPTISNGDVIATFTFEALKDSTNSTTITFNADDGLEFTCETEDLTNYNDTDDNFKMPTITLPVENQEQTHNITVKLTDENGTPLEGVIFKVSALDGTYQLLETASDGTIKLENQVNPQGEGPFVYKIEQKTVLDGYIKNEASSTVVVTFDESGNVQSVVGANATATNNENNITAVITNEKEIQVERETFYMELTKVDENNEIIASDTATFKIASPVATDKTVTTMNGKTTQIEFKAPVEAGTYPYVIEETKVPEGYNKTQDNVILDLKFENISNVITLTSCTIVSYGKAATIDTSTGSKIIKMDIVNKKETLTTRHDYTINIEKVKNDNLKTRITTDSAGFSVTYNEKSEYIRTNALGKATYNFSLNSDEIDTTNTYSFTIEEVKAPKGYLLDSTKQIVNLTFNEDGTINTMNVEGTKIVKLNATSNDANIQIINEEEPSPTVLTSETFNLVLNKQDSNGNLIKTDSATFNLICPDGTKQTYSTTNGVTPNISLSAPNAAGKQVYFIQEIKAPTGYEKLTQGIAIEMTFVEDNGKVVLNSAILKGEVDTNLTPTKVNGTNTLNINVQNKKIEKYYIGITNADKDTDAMLSGAVFKAKNTSTSEYTYIDNNKIEIDMPNVVGTVVYTIEQINVMQGYNISKNQTTLSLDFRADDLGNIYLYNYTVTGIDAQKETTTDLNTAIIKIKNEKEQEEIVVTKDIYSIELIKVDSITGEIITDDATFEIIPTAKKTYSTVEGVITIDNIIAGEDDLFVIKEKVAPTGYELLDKSIVISLITAQSNNNISIEGLNIEMGASFAEAKIEDNTIKIKIKNTKQIVEPTITKNPYSIEIAKVDADTDDVIEQTATFNVTEGNTSNSYTTINGKITLSNLIPGEEGTNRIYVITETKEPDGYQKLDKSIVVNVKYIQEEYVLKVGEVTILSGEDVASVILDGETIKLKVKNNLKEPEALYVKSKKDSEGNYMYDVLQSYNGQHYSIDNPFIDTRIAKSGNNITIQQFIDNLDSNGVLTVWDENGNQLPTTSKVKTKMVLKANKDDQEMLFTIIIKGDADGDGRVRSKDLDILIKHLTEEKNETNSYSLRALDLYDDGGDGKIRSTDLNKFYEVLSK